METWTIKKLLDWTTDHFKRFNIEWPHLEAEILLAYSLSLKRIDLYTNYGRILSKEELSRYKTFIERRSKREPIAYITNNKPFMSLDFYVDRSVLIPRPETELLVETVIDMAKKFPTPHSELRIADIGTGSGCIAISLAKYLPKVNVIGIDSSEYAIKIAQKNAKHHKVDNRCQFVMGNMFEALFTTKTQRHKEPQRFDIVVSNPPYIPTDQIDKLEEDVKIWEPRHALDGGKDGLDYIRKLIKQAPNHLTTYPPNNLSTYPPNLLLIEIGFDQGEKVRKIAEDVKKYEEVKIIKDLTGKERIFLGKLKR